MLVRSSFVVLALALSAGCTGERSPTSPSPAVGTSGQGTRSLEIVGGSNPVTSFEETVALQALLRQSTGASLDRTDAVQWTSSNTAVARVTANGIVTGRRNGSVVIAATLDSLTAARAMTIAVPTRIVIDEPVTATLIPFNPRFRWHVEHPEPDAEYRVRIYVDKGGYGCDRGGEAVHDAGTGQCATIELSRVAFGLGESAAFAVYADSSTGAAFCGEVFLRVSPPMPLRPPDPACPVAPRSTR